MLTLLASYIIVKINNVGNYIQACREVLTTINLPLFSGILASLSAAIALAPDDIPTYIPQKLVRVEKNNFDLSVLKIDFQRFF